MKARCPRSLTSSLCALAFCLTGASSAHALQAMPDESLSDVTGQDGLNAEFSTNLLTAAGLAMIDDGTTLTFDSLKLQTKTASPFAYTMSMDAGANGVGGSSIQFTINQALTRQFIGTDGWHVGASSGMSGGFGAEFQGTLASTLRINSTAPTFSGSFNLALDNTSNLYHVEDGNQLALQSTSMTLSVPDWSANINALTGLNLNIPSASLLLNASAVTLRSGGTAYSNTGTTTAFALDSRLDLSAVSLSAVGGGGLGTQGMKLALAGSIGNTSYLRLSDDGNSWRADSISGSFNLPRLTLDVATGPDRMQVNIGNIATPGIAGSTASANLYVGNINLNGGARALGLGFNVGNFDAALSLRPGGANGEGLGGDLQWRANNGYVRFYDEAGSQYLTWGTVLNQGTATGWTLDLISTGLRLNMPSLVGDLNVGGTTINGSSVAWTGKMHYDMGLDLTFKPGGASGQGLGLDAIWAINNPGTTTQVEFSDGTDNYGFYGIGGKITATGGSIDVVNDNDGGALSSNTPRLKVVLPNNVTDASNISRISSIKMGGVDMGNMQFNNFKTYLSVDMWGH